ncbi:glycosyltransferase family 4 protein [Flavobacterium columnare]|uniref:Glycosyltransferase family 1 protein n=1 Tax=Flavobacterium columnare TaxID=996 RepID=A0AA94JR48_9FLAO|nr:glycosyltransferase family 4 protein [Flavobacterium columnare]MCH4829052.1 glycosyltransferase family 4 protein [Flavobacterium columnare]MCH4833828.1 glycosyltransferase family 4 protein [Flavobacterium columnare]
MRILRIYWKIPPVSGGMENHIYNLTIEQNKEHSVVVVFNEGEAISPFDIKIGYIKYNLLKPQSLGIFLFYLNVIWKLVFLNQRFFDVIHIHGDWSSLLLVRILKRITKAKTVVFSMHGKFSDGKIYSRKMAYLLKNINHVFSTGFETGQKLITITSKNKVTIQPSGVSKVFYKDKIRDFVNVQNKIITIANINEKKNIEFIVELAKRNPNLHFDIVGKGNLENKIKKIANNEGLTNFKILGSKSPDDIRLILDNSTCFLLTSIEEGTPTVVLEAMTRGLPVITSNVGGIGNIVKNNKNGFVIDDFSFSLFSEKLNFLNENQNVRKKIYELNLRESENFAWDIVANKITSITLKKHYESIARY